MFNKIINAEEKAQNLTQVENLKKELFGDYIRRAECLNEIFEKRVFTLADKQQAQKILDEHWVNDEQFEFLKANASEQDFKYYAIQFPTECKLPFDTIMYVLDAVDESALADILKKKIFDRVDNGKLNPVVVNQHLRWAKGKLGTLLRNFQEKIPQELFLKALRNLFPVVDEQSKIIIRQLLK